MLLFVSSLYSQTKMEEQVYKLTGNLMISNIYMTYTNIDLMSKYYLSTNKKEIAYINSLSLSIDNLLQNIKDTLDDNSFSGSQFEKYNDIYTLLKEDNRLLRLFINSNADEDLQNFETYHKEVWTKLYDFLEKESIINK